MAVPRARVETVVFDLCPHEPGRGRAEGQHKHQRPGPDESSHTVSHRLSRARSLAAQTEIDSAGDCFDRRRLERRLGLYLGRRCLACATRGGALGFATDVPPEQLR